MRRKDVTHDDVQQAVEAILETEGTEDVNIDLQGDKVLLSGIVDDLADKVAAEEAIQGLRGVGHIENKITISTDGRLTDDEVVELAEAKLEEFNLPVIGIECHHGVLYLKGQVRDVAESLVIERALHKVIGVVEIHNNLRSDR